MNIIQCIEYLNNLPKTTDEMTTEHIRRLMSYMNHPEKSLKVIHITGTNGKGSTAKMLESVLIANGYKTGLYTSPSLISINEGISINGQWITDTLLEASMNQVITHCKSMVHDGHKHPTIFECVTASAVHAFAHSNLDIAIIEVGLGGENDATNIFFEPLLSIITTISLDHTEYLGSTLKSIATAKAGIIKKERPVLIGYMGKEACEVIKKQAQILSAPLWDLNEVHTNIISEVIAKDTFIKGNRYPLAQKLHIQTEQYNETIIHTTLQLPLLGVHQQKNVMLVLFTLELLKKEGFDFDTAAIYKGLSQTNWPCRCSYFIHQNQRLLIDGAHNSDKIKALCNMKATTLPEINSADTMVLFSALKDKNIEDMLLQLSAQSDHILCTEIAHERGQSVEIIATLAKKYFKKVDVIKTPTEALRYALSTIKPELLIITGSLYMTIPLYYQQLIDL